MTEITMPRLSESMEDGTILRWLKRDGEHVASGEDLVEIETDKATVTHASEVDGTVETLAEQGTTHPVGAVIARVRTVARRRERAIENASDGARDRGDGAGEGPDRARDRSHADADVPTSPPEDPAWQSTPVVAGDGNGGSPAGERTAVGPAATPLARRAARAHGIELAGLRGTGPRGRVTQADVLAAAGVVEPRAAAPASERRPAAGGTPVAVHAAKEDHERQQPTPLQQRIARRMAEAKATIPDFEVQTQASMEEALAIRERLKEAAGDDPVPSLNDLVIRACAVALRRHPRVNASYVDGEFKLFRRVNVGFAVAAENALIVATVFDADAKTLGTIADETRRLAERVRSGSAAPSELSGATFTLSNLGMFGMTAIRPIINPPQAAILGVGAVQRTLARRAGEIVERATMTLTLVADHRILYGADAARFLTDVRELLESPLKLAL